MRKQGVPIHAFQWPKDKPKPQKPHSADALRSEDTFRRARRYA